MRERPPLIIVGGGVAGLSVALAAAPRQVLLFMRDSNGADSASALAQGGIAAALAADDSPAAHARDTLQAGADHNDADAVRYLTVAAPTAIARLQALGLALDRHHDGRLRLAREGGHRADRIVHAGGDASGARLLAALLSAVRRAGHIDVRPVQDVHALLRRGDALAGIGYRDSTGRGHVCEAPDVVLATGGIGALFAATTNPAGADGSGLALGLAADAQARDLEFIQFHPTALAVPARIGSGQPLPLVTEALRGAGARLHDGEGRALMDGLHPMGDLAPRDKVARRVWQVLREGGQVWLDGTALGADWPQHFPTVLATCREHGIDPVRHLIPVTPAAHFHMGGLAVDHDGRSSVPGLYAVGEVACNGVHGGNRLASNSLLEGLVFGHRLGRHLSTTSSTRPARGTHHCSERGAAAQAGALAELRALLWLHLGLERDERGLGTALRLLRADDGSRFGWQGRLAERLLHAALLRRESLGAHWRCDGGV